PPERPRPPRPRPGSAATSPCAARVQGVGFRPFVYTLAEEHGLTGWVTNDADGVHTEVEGPPAAVDAFTGAIGTRAPPLALVESVEHRAVPVTHDDGGFTIRPPRPARAAP
ncbi:hydrogenase maturation protein HypF, partial [Streptomyces sp. Ncost-T6T-2b]